jgi:hypothetical protein
MKKILFMAAIIICCLSTKFVSAQIHVRLGVGVNINSQPEWGPVGYDHADYYYIPDVGAYYDVNAHQYVYSRNNVWVHAAYLPGRYRNYDMYNGYKVVVNSSEPWRHDNDYRTRYAGYRGRHDQQVIRDNHDEKYRNHWHEDNGRHNGNGNGHGNRGGNDKGHGDGHGDHGHGHDN